MIRLGVTGTDTGVGKTLVAVGLLAAARRRGLAVAAMKPVETGIANGEATDGTRLATAAGGLRTDTCPYEFAEPLAPLVAARRAATAVDLTVLDRAFARLTDRCDAMIVEGAGGLLVPLGAQVTYADLFRRWGLDVLVVAANRLGALNHTLLTVRAAETAGLVVRGVVLNTIEPEPPTLAQETNAATLTELLPGLRVFSWPWLGEPNESTLRETAERSGLAALMWDEALAPIPVGHSEPCT